LDALKILTTGHCRAGRATIARMEHDEEETQGDDEQALVPASSGTGGGDRQLRSRAANELDVHGGFVLIGGGVGLVALACIFASQATVAPIFAVFGATLLVIGAFYSRIKGPLRAGRDGFSFTVDEAQRLALERDYPPDIIEQIPDRVAEVVTSPRISERVAEDVADYVVRSFSSDVRSREEGLLNHFGTWLEEQGLPTVRKHVRTPDFGYDLIAENPDTIVIVEAKLGPKTVGTFAVNQALAMPPPADLHGRRVRRALIVPYELKVSEAAIGLAATRGLEVYEVADNGGIKQVV
jgi:hypothetical protein